MSQATLLQFEDPVFDAAFRGFDHVHSAIAYLAAQFHSAMTPAEAKAHFEAREILIRLELGLLRQQESRLPRERVRL